MRSISRLALVSVALLVACVAAPNAEAAPPYDVTLTFTAPSSGGPVDSYNFYIDDCADTGPVGPAFAQVTSGQTLPAALQADGSFEMCVRTENAAGENPDPGPVALVDVADLPLPGLIENLDIQISCPNGGCSVNVTVTP